MKTKRQLLESLIGRRMTISTGYGGGIIIVPLIVIEPLEYGGGTHEEGYLIKEVDEEMFEVDRDRNKIFSGTIYYTIDKIVSIEL